MSASEPAAPQDGLPQPAGTSTAGRATDPLDRLPPELLELVLDVVVRRRAPAYLAIDRAGRLVDWGGAVEAYGLTRLARGGQAAEQVFFLEGLLPPAEDHLFLPWVQTGPVTQADMHVIRGAEADWVVLLDAAHERRARQPRQQAVNEQSLRREQAPFAKGPNPNDAASPDA